MSPLRIAAALCLLLIVLVTFLFARSPFVDRLFAIYDGSGANEREQKSNQEVTRLTGQVNSSTTEIPRGSRGDDPLAQLAEKVASLSNDVATDRKNNNSRFREMDQQVVGLRGDFKRFSTDAYSLVGDLRDTVGQIAKQDGPDRWNPSILSNMSRDRKFKNEMEQAVHKTMHAMGTLLIYNETGYPQWMSINNEPEILIPAGNEAVKIQVQTGTVVTELRGFEAPRNWSIAPPSYEQKVVIK